MVKVTFDSNVLFDLKKLSENEIEGIRDLQVRGNVNSHFNWPNFEEFIKGFNADSFPEKVRESKIFSKITVNGSILETPNEIVRRDCEIFCGKESRVTLERSREKMMKVIFLMRKIALGGDFDEAERIKQILVQSDNEGKSSDESVRKSFPKALAFLRTLPPNTWEFIFQEMLKRLNVVEEIRNMNPKIAFEKIFSCRYRLAAHWGNVQRRMALGQQPPFSETNDTTQACYLSVVDYWITNDVGAKLNLEKAEEIGLLRKGETTNRVIAWQEYLGKLAKKELHSNLAPCKTSSYKYLIDGAGNVQFVST